MKSLKVINVSKRLLSLGCKNGRMMSLNVGETKIFDSELATLFEKEIVQYHTDGFIDIQEDKIIPKAPPRQKAVVDKKTKNTLKD